MRNKTVKRKKPGLLDFEPSKKYLRQAKAATLDAKGMLEEIVSLHNKRMAEGLKTSKLSASRIRKALVREQGVRSRLLAIHMEANVAYNALNVSKDAAVVQLMATRADAFPMTTKTEQKAHMAHLFRQETTILEDLREARDAADMVMQDIDKAAWNMKAIIQTYELETRPETSGL